MIDNDLLEELRQHEVDTTGAWFELDRRGFLKLFAGGLVVCASARKLVAQESGTAHARHELPKDVASWIHIGEDGIVTVFTGKVEVGQNIRTSLAQQVAEELRVPMSQVKMVMGDTDLTPWDMGTFGSRTTPTMAPVLRDMAIAAREVLVALAAKQWNANAAALVVQMERSRILRMGGR